MVSARGRGSANGCAYSKYIAFGTDWYIDQMQCKQYESEPLKITIPRVQYLYGTNDYPYVINAIDRRSWPHRQSIFSVIHSINYRMARLTSAR